MICTEIIVWNFFPRMIVLVLFLITKSGFLPFFWLNYHSEQQSSFRALLGFLWLKEVEMCITSAFLLTWWWADSAPTSPGWCKGMSRLHPGRQCCGIEVGANKHSRSSCCCFSSWQQWYLLQLPVFKECFLYSRVRLLNKAARLGLLFCCMISVAFWTVTLQQRRKLAVFCTQQIQRCIPKWLSAASWSKQHCIPRIFAVMWDYLQQPLLFFTV